jgi:hypothetical protein
MPDRSTHSSRRGLSLSWALRAVVVAGAAAVLLIDWYHRLRPSSSGVPIWAFPFIPVIVVAGPAALGLLAAETVVTLKRRTGLVPRCLDAGLVAAWLVLWFAHL